MRVLLINPFYPISETPSPPLGLAYLGAALEHAGIQVKILDYVVYPYRRKALESFLRDFNPHLVGATAVTMTFDPALQILKEIKTIDPGILTVMGGPHVTFCARDSLQAFPELDVVVFGEGEKTLVELALAVCEGHPLDRVDGIAYRADSKIRMTAKRRLIKNLDTIPLPARHLIPLGRYRMLSLPVSMTTSRGCPYKCIFCAGRKMVGAKVRYHGAERVAAELEYLANLNFHQINIVDDLFTANQHHCLAVCEEILRRNLRINWTAFARVDTVSEKLLSRMKAAGCTAVSFGVESANPAILKTIKKGITLQQIRNAVAICRRLGIRPYASFILGLPGETRETIQASVTFAAELQQQGLAYGFHILAPFPGTEVRENADKLGIRILTDDWSRYDANRAVIETASASRHMLEAVVIDWEKQYNQYLGHINNRIQQGTASADETRQLQNLEHTTLIYELMINNQIEKNGVMPKHSEMMNTEKGFEILFSRIKDAKNTEPQKLKAVLQRALENGDLALSDRNGKVGWKWRSFLPSHKISKRPKQGEKTGYNGIPECM